MTKILNFALKIERDGREDGTCKVLRPCHPPPKKKIWNVHQYMYLICVDRDQSRLNLYNPGLFGLELTLGVFSTPMQKHLTYMVLFISKVGFKTIVISLD